MKKIIICIFLVLLVAGCTGMPDIFGNIFGTQKKTKELPPDVIVVQNIHTLPAPPINTGDQFSVSFEVANQEEQREVKDVAYKLLDSGLCKWRSGNLNESTFTTEGNYFLPKQVEFVEWTFNTPNASEIAYLSTKCPIRFRVNYSFEAVSEIDVDVISEQKYSQLQQTGGFKTFVPTLSMGRGPIKVLMEFGASLPVKNNTVLPIYITVQDKGTGLYSTIPDEADKRLVIKIPNRTTGFIFQDCGERFTCDSNTNECWNNQNITMIERKSPTFRCSFTTPDVPIEKIYNIEASLNYTYDVTNEVDVEVKPIR